MRVLQLAAGSQTAFRPPRTSRQARGAAVVPSRKGAAPRATSLRASAVAGLSSATTAGTVTVQFVINKQLTFGQEMVLVGDAEALGGWQLEAAPVMAWSEGDDWRVAVALPVGAPVEYKFAIKDPHGPPVWEECGNRSWAADGRGAVLSCCWDSVDVTTAPSDSDDGALSFDLPPAYRPAQPITASSFSSAVSSGRDAVSRVSGAVAAASGATAAAEAVVAAAEAAAAAVAQAVSAAEAVVAELTAAGLASSNGGGAHSGNGSAAAAPAGFSPEQLAFLQRKRSGSPGPATAVATRPVQQNAAAAAEAVLAATTAAAGAAARVVEVAESVAAELTGSPAAATSNGAGQARPAAAAAQAQPATAAGNNYTPEQLAFLRRKLNGNMAAPAAAGGPPAAGNGAAAPAAAQGNYTPEQLAFLRRKGASPPPPPTRGRSPSPSPRPSFRSRSPSPPPRGSSSSHAQYSPEQLAFLKRSGKL